MAAHALAVENLTLAIDGATVVDGVSFHVAAGETLALVGESGCGKSLTALSILQLEAPPVRRTTGHIAVAGRALVGLTEQELGDVRGRDVSIIFQEPTASLDPLMRVGAQIAEAITRHENVSAADARKRALDMLHKVGMPDAERRLDQFPFELSGGMCQRIMIAAALVCSPKLLIADEPTTALDVTIQAQILDLIRRLASERGTAVLLITHDMGIVANMAERVAVMYAGRIVELARTETLFTAPRHPYSIMLLASVPRVDVAPKSELTTIPGTVPTPKEMGEGCRFANRCPLVEPRCRAEAPPRVSMSAGHDVACWRADVAPRLMGGA
jgi:peptide/nickel transport system ATP-binding protein